MSLTTVNVPRQQEKDSILFVGKKRLVDNFKKNNNDNSTKKNAAITITTENSNNTYSVKVTCFLRDRWKFVRGASAPSHESTISLLLSVVSNESGLFTWACASIFDCCGRVLSG